LHVRKSLLFFLQARHVPAVESSSLRGAHGVLMRGEGVCVQGGGREGVIAMHNGFGANQAASCQLRWAQTSTSRSPHPTPTRYAPADASQTLDDGRVAGVRLALPVDLRGLLGRVRVEEVEVSSADEPGGGVTVRGGAGNGGAPGGSFLSLKFAPRARPCPGLLVRRVLGFATHG
jgi:hypothetical protein